MNFDNYFIIAPLTITGKLLKLLLLMLCKYYYGKIIHIMNCTNDGSEDDTSTKVGLTVKKSMKCIRLMHLRHFSTEIAISSGLIIETLYCYKPSLWDINSIINGQCGNGKDILIGVGNGLGETLHG